MLGSIRKSISKTLSRATEIITGNGPTPAKQFRNAILDDDEEKAITIYSSPAKEGDKCLCEELHPSEPFPSKKNHVAETPLLLASKFALAKLIEILLDRGGDPGALNSRKETCIHVLCSVPDKPEIRASIIEIYMSWNRKVDDGLIIGEKVSVNKVDIDGNTAVHNAALNGLASCVEKLVNYGAIISIVNKGNNTCCELADSNNHRDLAMMLELALVFQAEEFDLSEFDAFSLGTTGDLRGNLYLDTHSLSLSGVNSFVEEAIGVVSVFLGWMNAKKFRSRAEALLNAYAWDVARLRRDLMDDGTKVLTAAKMDATTQIVRPTADKVAGTASTQPHGEATTSVSSAPETTIEVAVAAPPPPPPATKEAPAVSTPTDDGTNGAETDEIQISLDETDAAAAASAAPASAPAPAPAQAPAATEEEPPTCTICCEEMLPEQEVAYFIKHGSSSVENHDMGRHCLTCLSGHSFCLDCWSSHVGVQVSDNGLGCLPCPGYKCGEILDLSWAPVLLKTQEAVNRLRTQRVRHVVDYAGLKHCPVEGCGLLVHIPGSTTSLTTASAAGGGGGSAASLLPHVAMCDNNHMFCVSCFQTAHSPCTCANYPQWFQLVQEETKSVLPNGGAGDAAATASGDDIANALWVAANTKRCPRCATAIEKDEGCNHMSCRKCRKEFCWICMQDWSLHSENTGGYFQCNRFQEAASGGTGGGEGGEGGGGDVWSEERGNAHAETLRMRQRNRTMARFIHHFTRFQAHGQSFQMESRMSKDTYKRIEDGLKQTVIGHLKWLPGTIVPNPMTTTTTTTGVSPATSPRMAAQGGLKDSAMSPLEAALLSPDPMTAEQTLILQCIQEMELGSGGSGGSLLGSVGDHVTLTKHGVKPSPYLQFLADGFHELLKCRQFLQWTYPYAYFEFQDDQPASSRRRTWLFRAQDHRTSFEFMQADLESTVETLSDICARRRMRASRAQIIQATKAAKQKRVEFEGLLLAYAIAKQQHATATPPHTPASEGVRSGDRGRSGGSRGVGSASRSRSNPSSGRRQTRLFDDSVSEIATLIRDLEQATGSYAHDDGHTPSRVTRASTPPQPPRTPGTADGGGDAAAAGSASRRRTTGGGSANRSTGRSTSSHTRSTLRSSMGRSSSSDSDSDHHEVMVRPPRPPRSANARRQPVDDDGAALGDEELDMTAFRRALEREAGLAPNDLDDTATFLRFMAAAADSADSDGGAGGGDGASMTTTTRPTGSPSRMQQRYDAQILQLAQRVEEEEQLNRAILLSLRENNSDSSRKAPSEANIATLMAMGFTRDESVAALHLSGDDVEAAAMQLIG